MRWAPVPGFPRYRVSDEGYVESRKKCDTEPYTWKRLKLGTTPFGYRVATLCRDGKQYPRLVHCLVLEAFVGPRPPGMHACHHPDPTPTNNRLENLRWDTPRNNSKDTKLHGRRPTGERTNAAKLTTKHVQIIKSLIRDGISDEEIARACRVSKQTINGIRDQRTWVDVVCPNEPFGSLEDLGSIPLLSGIVYRGLCLQKQRSTKHLVVRLDSDHIRILNMIATATEQPDYTHILRRAIRYVHARMCFNSPWLKEFAPVGPADFCCPRIPNWPDDPEDCTPPRAMHFSVSNEYLIAIDDIIYRTIHQTYSQVVRCAILNEFARCFPPS